MRLLAIAGLVLAITGCASRCTDTAAMCAYYKAAGPSRPGPIGGSGMTMDQILNLPPSRSRMMFCTSYPIGPHTATVICN